MLACAWIERRGTPPPLGIELLVEAALPDLDSGLQEEIGLLLARKRSGAHPEPEPCLLRVDSYLSDRIEKFEQLASTWESQSPNTAPALSVMLDEVFISVLQEVWNMRLG
ncbi:hypothetical protein POTG_03501 [Paenibacillus sp. oral taxon 786 str. D14]|uniref:DNA polymerase beta superfamily protein n=1 Tax=Paenibacillus sp. oral taxon 786 TaxID=652715 RepID=UPI0001AFDC7E|nr:nucleotidyltransferase domain-containing protein [Paenibacillus sp. oral taxon 786]EES71807.1 hypothetical protein POTG_03501 [Paenibacillus sp. oral taxon 786 str. D14]